MMATAGSVVPAWRVVAQMRNLGVMPPDTSPGGVVVRTAAELHAAVLADRGYHGVVKYVVIVSETGTPELRIPRPREYTGHPFLSGGRAEILAGGQIHSEANVLVFTNETDHFRTGPEQTVVLDAILSRMGMPYRLESPCTGRAPDLFVQLRVESR